MLLTFLPALLILKHFLIANLIDFCYSRARDRNNRYWVLDAVLWTIAELWASVRLYRWTGVNYKYWAVAELGLCVVSIAAERRALLGRELLTYFFWESVFFALYVLIGVIT